MPDAEAGDSLHGAGGLDNDGALEWRHRLTKRLTRNLSRYDALSDVAEEVQLRRAMEPSPAEARAPLATSSVAAVQVYEEVGQAG